MWKISTENRNCWKPACTVVVGEEYGGWVQGTVLQRKKIHLCYMRKEFPLKVNYMDTPTTQPQVVFFRCGFQNGVPEPTGSASPGNLLKLRVTGPLDFLN